jgi:hypothetical protein
VGQAAGAAPGAGDCAEERREDPKANLHALVITRLLSVL